MRQLSEQQTLLLQENKALKEHIERLQNEVSHLYGMMLAHGTEE